MNEAVVSPSPAGGSRPKGLGFSEGGLAAEAAAAALAIAALLVALSLATDNPATGENWIGRMGGVTAKGLVFTFGRIVAWIVPVTLALAASASWRGRSPAHLPERLLAGFGAAVCACALLALRHADTDLRAQRDAFGGGGALGHWLMHRELAGLGSALGGVGAVVAFGGLMLLALCGAADTRPRTVMTGLAAAAARFRPARIAAAARRGRDLWRRLSEGYGEPPDGSSRPMSAPLPLEPAKTSEPFNPSRGTTAAADLIAPRSPRREDSRVFPFVADPELAAAPAAAATTQAARGFIPDPPSDGGDAHSAFAATAAMATAATLGTGPSGSSGRWRAVAAAAETMAPAPSAPVTAPRSHFGPETEHDRPTWAPRATTEGAATTTATTAGSMSTTREETTDSDEDSVGHIAAVPRDPALSGIADHVMAPRRSVVLEQPTLPLAPQVAVPVVSAPEAAPEAALMPAPAIPVPAYPPAPVSTREPEPKPAITIALPAAVVQPVAEFDSPATSMPPPVAFPDPAARVEPAPPPADIYSGLDDDGGSGAWRAVAAADLAAMTAFDEPPPPLRIESETAPSFPAAPATDPGPGPGPGPAISPVFATSTAHVAPVAPPPPPASEAPVYPVIPARPTESQAAAATVYPVPDTDGFRPIDAYDLPVIDLLDTPPDTAKSLSHDDLAEVSQSLESTLQTFGITATVVQVTQGPTVTRFEMQPAPGVKVSRIASLENDIAMLLKADSVRIIAPVPGKGTVGLEVPNRAPTPVFLREILASDAFRDHKSPLAVALGKTIDDEPFVADLVKMPHLLIAGATGAGKSVCLNSIICSILYRTTPDQVRLLMIDPKMVELKVYEAAPHLLAPVVCDTRKAAAALNWAVEEMEDRLRRMSDLNVRGIEGYNEVARDPESHAKGRGKVFDTMPYIVVIIDELADLMITAKNEVEQPIIRLGQMSRATGIHLILATQRPSVNVITGLIKANFPSRIAFKVSSKIDSRTILDGSGAETLLGRGDMLYLANGTPKPMRLQGCFVSDQEVGRVVDWVKEQREADYIREEFKTAQEIAAERVAMMEEAAEEQRQNDAAARRAAMPARPLGPPRPMLRPTANGLILDGREGRPGSSPVPPPPGERRAEYDDRADGEVDFSAAAAGAGSYLSSGVPGEGDSVDDELFRQSVRCVLQHRRASVSLLQKRLKIGFVRASRVMDMMEDAGIVGPAIDGKVREFNVDPDEYLAQIEEDERDGL